MVSLEELGGGVPSPSLGGSYLYSAWNGVQFREECKLVLYQYSAKLNQDIHFFGLRKHIAHK